MDGWMDAQMDGWRKKHWIEGWIEGWYRTGGWMLLNRCHWMDATGWMDELMDGCGTDRPNYNYLPSNEFTLSDVMNTHYQVYHQHTEGISMYCKIFRRNLLLVGSQRERLQSWTWALHSVGKDMCTRNFRHYNRSQHIGFIPNSIPSLTRQFIFTLDSSL